MFIKTRRPVIPKTLYEHVNMLCSYSTTVKSFVRTNICFVSWNIDKNLGIKEIVRVQNFMRFVGILQQTYTKYMIHFEETHGMWWFFQLDLIKIKVC